ncbi:macrolide ABC transporter ATP-binding protein [Christensenellaceae bacterium]|nr:macrolide ABC transporter ATP-binding protein [Christensenellaceae bacterium]BDF61346.1 macrolide ABC transporter ATP-binding protein [Christensenellaceae bacterium]
MIQMTDVSKVYEIGNEKLYALNHATLRIEDGEFVAIIGPSGSGKSTLMNIIGCLDTADSGEYMLDGQAIDDYSEDELTRVRNFKIGFVFQNFNLLSKLSALENVELPLIYQGLQKKEYHQRAIDALARMGLSERIRHKPSELSGGQQQRVAIARALVTNPSLILADEPTGNLDHKTGAEILELFSELHKNGNTIVLITHDDGIARQAQRRIRILDGRVMEGA